MKHKYMASKNNDHIDGADLINPILFLIFSKCQLLYDFSNCK